MGSTVTITAGSQGVYDEFVSAAFTASLRGLATGQQCRDIGAAIGQTQNFSFPIPRELIPVLKAGFRDMADRGAVTEHTESALGLIGRISEAVS